MLDFASLYPSIIIGFNLCYSTLLNPDDEHDPDTDFEEIVLGPGRVQ